MGGTGGRGGEGGGLDVLANPMPVVMLLQRGTWLTSTEMHETDALADLSNTVHTVKGRGAAAHGSTNALESRHLHHGVQARCSALPPRLRTCAGVTDAMMFLLSPKIAMSVPEV